ncbi:hypothetical protein [Leuconostoc mesenteroides]|uniref:hypothetical protein n=1 Tax=Leuconostoc mesenteroides TaxID=1245 RepID=UPI00235E79DE|nr:hypothetical protein [Leuconostoc mesenteroides]
MNKNVTTAYEQPVNDDGNVLVADFTAQKTNDVVQNITVSINTIVGYQTNKDKVITAFDEFLKVIQSDNLPVVSLDNGEDTSDSETASAEVLSSESESEVTSESESESQSESGSTLESQSDVSQSESGSQSESESDANITSDSTSDSTSALSQ